MNDHAIQARATEIIAELRSTKALTSQRFDELNNELDELAVAQKTHARALNYAGSADPIPYGGPQGENTYNLPRTKMIGTGNAPRVAPASPLQMDDQQIDALWQAAKSRTPFRIEIGQKGIEHSGGFLGNVGRKGPMAESSLSGQQLPPVQVPGPNGNYGVMYERFRVFGNIPTVLMDGPQAAYLIHTGNANEANGVAELGTKPDLGPIVTEAYVKPQKIAGTVSASMEILQDHSEFAAFLPSELARSVINAESNYLINAGTSGGPTGAAFNGLLATSGTLTRAMSTDTPLDALSKAFVDLRTGSAFAEPDLVIVHPSTMGALRRQKDSQNRYLLDLLAGPGHLTGIGEEQNLWGVRTVISTQCPSGTAIVLSIAAGAAVGWVRMSMLVEFNPWGDTEWTTNTYSWRAEERISLSVPRPAAINIVTGLPTS